MARSCVTDPLEKFRFIVEFSTASGSESTALDRAGFLEVGMPKRSTNKIMYREGNDPDISSVSAGLSTMEDITLTRGQIKKIAGQDSALYRWMSAVHNPQPGHPGTNGSAKKAGITVNHAAAEYRKDITIKVLDRTGEVARTYKLFNAFPVNYVPGSDLAAGDDGDKLIESVTLAYEDFAEVAATPSASLSPTAAAIN